jgi:hypothetical protein
MNYIGGYFELELSKDKEYHSKAIKLNLGRTAFEYILRAKNIKKVFLPYYICDVLMKTLLKTGVKCDFYNIDENLEPIFDYSVLSDSDFLLYINYFGIKDLFIEKLTKKTNYLIIDNSQSFFSKPVSGVDTFYSPRKFFGIPDGGYLYTDKKYIERLLKDNSTYRFGHLIGRIENGAKDSYEKFKLHEQQLGFQSIKQMSNVTHRLLLNIRYDKTAEIRQNNFHYLHEKLERSNLLNIDLGKGSVPMVYPFMYSDKNLRSYLIQKKIFIAQYWPNVLSNIQCENVEYSLVNNTVHLPIDQRYSESEMKQILKIIMNYL